jgi:hypothetical protein
MRSRVGKRETYRSGHRTSERRWHHQGNRLKEGKKSARGRDKNTEKKRRTLIDSDVEGLENGSCRKRGVKFAKVDGKQREWKTTHPCKLLGVQGRTQ